MNHSNLNGRIPLWQPQESGESGGKNPDNGSIRVETKHALCPEFLDYLETRTDIQILAEGDSWFYLPWPGRSDLVEALEELHRHVASYAHHGDTLDQIAFGIKDEDGDYSPPGFDAVVAAAVQKQPKAVLFSAGGNDFVGPEFIILLNHKSSQRPRVRQEVIKYLIHDYIKNSYLHCARRLWAVSPNTKFITHGYADAYPSGIGREVFGIAVAGPWLLPAIFEKLYTQDEGRELVRTVIGEFNSMLKGLLAEDKRFVYVDFRPHVGKSQDDWYDELHLTAKALLKAGRVFNDAIAAAIGE